MTQEYINGFFTKCAESKLPYELAVELYKKAAGCGSAPAKADPSTPSAKPARKPVSPRIKALVEGLKAKKATAAGK